jgi:hypothetical protein
MKRTDWNEGIWLHSKFASLLLWRNSVLFKVAQQAFVDLFRHLVDATQLHCRVGLRPMRHDLNVLKLQNRRWHSNARRVLQGRHAHFNGQGTYALRLRRPTGH